MSQIDNLTEKIAPLGALDLVPLLLRHVSNQMLFGVIEFESKIEADRLTQAVNSLLDVMPLLAAQIGFRNKTPVWIVNADCHAHTLLRIINDQRGSESTKLPQPIANDSVRNAANIWLLRHPSNDTVVVGVDHVLTDAAGARDICYLLSAAYNGAAASTLKTIGLHQQIFSPAVIFGQSIPRIKKIRGILAMNVPRNSWRVPIYLNPTHVPNAIFIKYTSDRKCLVGVRKYAKSFDATVNDLLLATFFLSLLQEIAPRNRKSLAIQFTVDLRQYLKSIENIGLGNFSSTAYVRLTADNRGGLNTILQDIRRQSVRIKTNATAIFSALGTELLLRLDFRRVETCFKNLIQSSAMTGKLTPILTNFGIMDEGRLALEQSRVNNTYLVGPNLLIPGVMVSVSTFRQRLTLCAGLNRSAQSSTLIQRVVQGMGNQLDILGDTD